MTVLLETTPIEFLEECWDKLLKFEEEEINKLLKQDWFDNIGKIIKELYESTDYIDMYHPNYDSDYNSD